jgi:ribose transport system ATP-binding protein
MVEILKALSTNASLIIMDEPTSSLSKKESEILFRIIHQLKDRGVSILYISHRLEEVFQLSDRITVLRDGRKVGVFNRDQIVPGEVIRVMIGKELSEKTASRPLRRSDKPVALELKNLTSIGYYEDVSFEVKEGEILVLTGLVGSGRTEVLRSVFGADGYDSGEILFQGKYHKKNVRKSITRGFGFIPEDRRTQGFAPLLSVTLNVASTNYDKLSRFGVVNSDKENKLGVKAVEMVDLRPPNPSVPAMNLSGGNQQKVVLGKWLTRDLNVLLIDEPTVGIDVGAKDEIYKFIENLAEQNVAIVLVSSDVAEVLRVATRILIMRGGRIIKEFNDGVVTQEDILMASSGINPADKGGARQL